MSLIDKRPGLEVRVADARAALPAAHTLCISDHQLLVPIASGAYGEVWLARNVVGTLRAVKIVRRDRHASESFEREFKGLQKFEPVSRTHEGLVDILTLGHLSDGAGFYYVMELADQPVVAADVRRLTSSPSTAQTIASDEKSEPHVGCYEPRTLRADLKSRGALRADEVIALGLKLTSALAHLHAQGLVHRDVKPSNILFIGGEPKLADAGLVAAVDDARSLVGTAGYIAPEGPGTPQADLYALGKVLYEAAFGKDRQEFPALPADVASRPDHARLLELNALLLKACAADRRERYAKAETMRAELELLQAGKSVKRQHAWQRGGIHVKRLIPVAGVLAVVFTISYWLSMQRPLLTNSARLRSPTFVWSTNRLAQEEYLTGMRYLHEDGNNFQAIEHLKKATELDPNFAEGWARLAWAYITAGGEANARKGQEAAEKSVSLDPDLPYAHSVLASSRGLAMKWADSEEERQKAVSLNPNSQEILLESAINLAVVGRTNEALAHLERARRANPESASKLREKFYGLVYLLCRRYNEALEIFHRFPKGVADWQAQAYLAIGDYSNAIRYGRQWALERGEPTEQVNREWAALQNAFNKGGANSYWELSLELELPKAGYHHWVRLAAIYARLNRPDDAFKCLDLTREKTPMSFVEYLNTDLSFDSLHGDWRFQAYLKELWRNK